MKRFLIICGFLMFVVSVAILLWQMSEREKKQVNSVLKVTSIPQTSIFLNNQNIGNTPYEGKFTPGEYSIKLVPENSLADLQVWESKIKLNNNLLTYVNRELSDSELTSSGEVLNLEKISSKKGELIVGSTPDGASVKLAGVEKGNTPLALQNLEPGTYELVVSSVGFKERSVKIKVTPGFKLIANFQLGFAEAQIAPSPTPSPSSTSKASPKTSTKPSPSVAATTTPKTKATPPPKPYVEILDTPTGFLRVRSKPATTGEELGQVKPDEYFALLEEQSGWYKIEYQKDKEGWVSSQYAKKFE